MRVKVRKTKVEPQTLDELEEPMQESKNNRSLMTTARFFIWSGIGFVGLLNVQPWTEVAKKIAAQITTIPFLESLTSIPFLGGWVQFLVTNLVSLLGIVLWGLVQLMEVLPLMGRTSSKIESWRWIAYGFEAFVCFIRFPPYEGGMTAILEDSPNWDFGLIDWWMMALFIITMFSFEAFFVLIREIRAKFG